MYDAEKAQEIAIAQENARRDDYRKKIIQEARRRLLEEHAAKLQGYLPHGVFQDANEYREFAQTHSQSGTMTTSRSGRY
jgi:hypothetical protein